MDGFVIPLRRESNQYRNEDNNQNGTSALIKYWLESGQESEKIRLKQIYPVDFNAS